MPSEIRRGAAGTVAEAPRPRRFGQVRTGFLGAILFEWIPGRPRCCSPQVRIEWMVSVGGSVSENRRATRHHVSIAAKVTVDGSAHEATILNISLGGAQVASTAPKHSMGQHISLSFKVPSQQHVVEIGATVRWADSNGGVGLQFDGLRAQDVWALNEYFKKRVL
jgi:PilZ domain